MYDSAVCMSPDVTVAMSVSVVRLLSPTNFASVYNWPNVFGILLLLVVWQPVKHLEEL